MVPAVTVNPELGDNVAGAIVHRLQLHRQLIAEKEMRLAVLRSTDAIGVDKA